MIQSGLVFVIILGCYLSCSDSQITNSLSNGEIEQIKAKSLAILRNPVILSDLFSAIQILKAVQVTELPCNCEIIEKLLHQPSSVLDGYYGVSSAVSCGCAAQVTSDLVTEAANGLKVDLCLILLTVIMIKCMTFQQSHSSNLLQHKVQRFGALRWIRLILQSYGNRD